MFIDKAKIYLVAGKGGDGHISFRHEKCVEFGGPDGGNGGKGGSIYFVAQKGPNTLSAYRHAIKVKAPDGENGNIKNQYGKYGDDIYLSVPLGTVITTLDGVLLADLSKEGDTWLACKGGRGGKGNRCYQNSVRKAPRIAENGYPGEKKELYLELKLIADCGLVGLPNAGKSTLLSVVSNADPEIAPYPFTTKEPMLGSVRLSDNESFVMADLPGLIKGASLGKGMGFVFLRHIERCRVIIHVIDISSEEDSFQAFEDINNELGSYKMDLLKRPMIIALNKMDVEGADKKAEEFKKKLQEKYPDKYQVFEISAYQNKGIKPLLRAAYDLVLSTPSFVLYTPSAKAGETVYKAEKGGIDNKDYKIFLDEDGDYRVEGEKVIAEYRRINHKTEEGMMQLMSYLNSIGLDDELRKMGVKSGDTVVIDDFNFEYVE
jgi:GTP-binding protein